MYNWSEVVSAVVFTYQGAVSVQKETFSDFYEALEWFEGDPGYCWTWMQLIVFFTDGSSETWFRLPKKDETWKSVL